MLRAGIGRRAATGGRAVAFAVAGTAQVRTALGDAPHIMPPIFDDISWSRRFVFRLDSWAARGLPCQGFGHFRSRARRWFTQFAQRFGNVTSLTNRRRSFRAPVDRSESVVSIGSATLNQALKPLRSLPTLTAVSHV